MPVLSKIESGDRCIDVDDLGVGASHLLTDPAVAKHSRIVMLDDRYWELVAERMDAIKADDAERSNVIEAIREAVDSDREPQTMLAEHVGQDWRWRTG